MVNKELIKVETADNDLFLFTVDLLNRIEKKRPEHVKVVRIDNNHRTIFFISSPDVGSNISCILMEQKQKEGALKVERIPLE